MPHVGLLLRSQLRCTAAAAVSSARVDRMDVFCDAPWTAAPPPRTGCRLRTVRTNCDSNFALLSPPSIVIKEKGKKKRGAVAGTKDNK